MLEQNPETVRIAFLNYPLRSHRNALLAAQAALAANMQNRFWEFHDELFKHQNRLSREVIDQIAERLALDTAQFEKDLRNPEVVRRLQSDMRQAVQLQIRGVPSIYLNGKRLRDRSMQGFEKEIQKALKRAEGEGQKD